MSKKLGILALLILVLLFCVPVMLGIITESNVKRTLQNISEASFASDQHVNINFDSLSYQKGFFSSTATVTGRIIPAKDSGFVNDNFSTILSKSGNDFVIDMHIKHGPFIFAYDIKHPSRLGVGLIKSSVDLSVKKNDGKKERLPINLTSSISFSGNLCHKILLPAHAHQINKLLRVEWLDADLEVYHNANFSEYDWEFELDKVEVKHGLFGRLVLSDIDIRRSFSLDKDGDYHSSKAIIADEINLYGLGGNRITVDEFSHEIILSVEEKNLADMTMLLTIGKYKSSKGERGSLLIGLNGGNFILPSMRLAFANLFNKGIKATPENVFADFAASVTKDSIIKLQPMRFENSKGVLTLNGNIKPKYPLPDKLSDINTGWDLIDNLNISVKSSPDLAKQIASYVITLEERKKLLMSADNQQDPNAYLSEAKIEVSAETLAAKMEAWKKAGVIELDDNGYRFNLSFAGGSFKVNGNAL